MSNIFRFQVRNHNVSMEFLDDEHIIVYHSMHAWGSPIHRRTNEGRWEYYEPETDEWVLYDGDFSESSLEEAYQYLMEHITELAEQELLGIR